MFRRHQTYGKKWISKRGLNTTVIIEGMAWELEVLEVKMVILIQDRL